MKNKGINNAQPRCASAIDASSEPGEGMAKDALAGKECGNNRTIEISDI